jgi:hypothetical protein
MHFYSRCLNADNRDSVKLAERLAPNANAWFDEGVTSD